MTQTRWQINLSQVTVLWFPEQGRYGDASQSSFHAWVLADWSSAYHDICLPDSRKKESACGAHVLALKSQCGCAMSAHIPAPGTSCATQLAAKEAGNRRGFVCLFFRLFVHPFVCLFVCLSCFKSSFQGNSLIKGERKSKLEHTHQAPSLSPPYATFLGTQRPFTHFWPMEHVCLIPGDSTQCLSYLLNVAPDSGSSVRNCLSTKPKYDS